MGRIEHQDGHRQYPMVRVVGVWLVLIGIVIALATLVGGRFVLNPFVLMGGYGLSLYVTEINPRLKKRLALPGEPTRFQKRMSRWGDISLFPLMIIMGGSFIPGGDWRMVWLGTLFATGVHFLLFIPVHGKAMLYLSIVCTTLPIAGVVFRELPFLIIGIADGVVKILFGLYLFFRAESYLAQTYTPSPQEHQRT